MIGMSTNWIAWMINSPMPGHWKTVSVMIEKASSAPICRPMIVITGTSVFLSAWPKLMLRFAQAAGARELDVVGAHHLQHLGAHQPHDQRQLEQRERDRRHDDVAPALQRQKARLPAAEIDRAAAAEGRQPAEPDAEDQDQQNADQEGRQRDPDQRHGQEHAATARNCGAGRCRPPSARRRQRQHRETKTSSRVAGRRCRDQLADRLAHAVGDAEFALQRVADPA